MEEPAWSPSNQETEARRTEHWKPVWATSWDESPLPLQLETNTKKLQPI